MSTQTDANAVDRRVRLAALLSDVSGEIGELYLRWQDAYQDPRVNFSQQERFMTLIASLEEIREIFEMAQGLNTDLLNSLLDNVTDPLIISSDGEEDVVALPPAPPVPSDALTSRMPPPALQQHNVLDPSAAPGSDDSGDDSHGSC